VAGGHLQRGQTDATYYCQVCFNMY